MLLDMLDDYYTRFIAGDLTCWMISYPIKIHCLFSRGFFPVNERSIFVSSQLGVLLFQLSWVANRNSYPWSIASIFSGRFFRKWSIYNCIKPRKREYLFCYSLWLSLINMNITHDPLRSYSRSTNLPLMSIRFITVRIRKPGPLSSKFNQSDWIFKQ